MLMNKGQHGSERILYTQSIESMTTDQLTPEQKPFPAFFQDFSIPEGGGLASAS